ncbi:hypothetical protein KO361_02750 [Candidatus Woesearchaeota archaeon]|nr:hypothetical protein [Candidatus Woesearchaeota archaeon]
MKSRIFFLVLLSFVLLLSAFASSEIIIEKYSPGFISGAKLANPVVCICGELTDEIILKNSAPYPQVFELSTNIDKAIISFSQITLNPGQEIVVPVLITSGCNDKPSVENYEVLISSTTGVEQVITRSLKVEKCQTIEAKLFVDKNQSVICEPVVYSLVLKNPSTLVEDYLIGPLNNVEFFDQAGYEVSLLPGQMSVLNFTFTPRCDVSGEIINTFRIKSSSTLSAELSHSLFIVPGYDFSLTGSEELELCRYEIIGVPYVVSNNGLTNNTYNLRIRNNPSFVSLSVDSVALEPGQSASFELLFEPGFKTRDSYEFSLIVSSLIGDVEVNKKIFLDLSECYDSSLTILSPDSLRVCQGSESLVVSLKNNGLFEETYNLETNTPNAVLSDSVVTVNPGEEKFVDLIIDASSFSGKILFGVSAYSSKNLLKHWDDSIVLDIVPSYKCSEIGFPSRYVVYSRFYDDEVVLRIQNKGFVDNTFDVAYYGSDFLELNEEKIFLEAQSFHDLVLNKTRDYDSDVYFFSLNITSDEGHVYSKEFKLVLTGTPLLEKIKNYASDNPCFLFALIIITTLLLVLVAYLLLGPFLGRIVKLILVISLLLSVIVLLIIHGLPERINPALVQSEDPYAFRFYQGKELVIDLNNYVIDPDNDTLFFEVIDESDDLIFDLSNSLLKIRSDNFTGSDRFRVLADDGQGGEVITPRFMVEVVEPVSLSFFERYEKYCVYINMLLLLVLASFLFLLKSKSFKSEKVLVKPKKKKVKVAKSKKVSKKSKPRKYSRKK